MDVNVFVTRVAPLLPIPDLLALRCVDLTWRDIVDTCLPASFNHMTRLVVNSLQGVSEELQKAHNLKINYDNQTRIIQFIYHKCDKCSDCVEKPLTTTSELNFKTIFKPAQEEKVFGSYQGELEALLIIYNIYARQVGLSLINPNYAIQTQAELATRDPFYGFGGNSFFPDASLLSKILVTFYYKCLEDRQAGFHDNKMNIIKIMPLSRDRDSLVEDELVGNLIDQKWDLAQQFAQMVPGNVVLNRHWRFFQSCYTHLAEYRSFYKCPEGQAVETALKLEQTLEGIQADIQKRHPLLLEEAKTEDTNNNLSTGITNTQIIKRVSDNIMNLVEAGLSELYWLSFESLILEDSSTIEELSKLYFRCRESVSHLVQRMSSSLEKHPVPTMNVLSRLYDSAQTQEEKTFLAEVCYYYGSYIRSFAKFCFLPEHSSLLSDVIRAFLTHGQIVKAYHLNLKVKDSSQRLENLKAISAAYIEKEGEFTEVIKTIILEVYASSEFEEKQKEELLESISKKIMGAINWHSKYKLFVRGLIQDSEPPFAHYVGKVQGQLLLSYLQERVYDRANQIAVRANAIGILDRRFHDFSFLHIQRLPHIPESSLRQFGGLGNLSAKQESYGLFLLDTNDCTELDQINKLKERNHPCAKAVADINDKKWTDVIEDIKVINKLDNKQHALEYRYTEYKFSTIKDLLVELFEKIQKGSLWQAAKIFNATRGELRSNVILSLPISLRVAAWALRVIGWFRF